MKDSLKDFIANHREHFDDQAPSEKTWNKIESMLPGRKRQLWNSLVIWRAAALVFLGLAIYAFASKNLVTPSQKKELATLQGEFKDLESFYSSEIASKVALIESLEGAESIDLFTQDYQKLDAMYQVLKEEMKLHPSKKVKDALILNFLIRIDLLNQQLHELDKGFKPMEKTKEVSA